MSAEDGAKIIAKLELLDRSARSNKGAKVYSINRATVAWGTSLPASQLPLRL